MAFRTPYTEKVKFTKTFEKPSLTDQAFKQECDLNYIIKSYVKTGKLPQMTMT